MEPHPVRRQHGEILNKLRLNVGLKLGFWLALLGIVSTAATGYYAYSRSRAMLVDAAESKLLAATQVLSQRFTYSLVQITNDVRFISSLPMVRKIANQAPASAEVREQERMLEDVFASLLDSHPEYFQVRVIGVKDNCRELIRVDRDDAGITRIRGSDLQEKGHYPYVFEALRPNSGEFYFSQINLNREQGAHQGLNKPTLRIASPIKSDDDSVFGIIVINVDLEGMFERMGADIPDDLKVILTNDKGDYLVHPDASKIFGFDQGRRVLIQDDIKDITVLLNEKKKDLVATADAIDTQDSAAVAAFVRTPFGAHAGHRFVLVGLATPLEKVLAESRMLGLTMIQITLFFSLLAVLVSFVLARVLAHPLNLMAKALGQFEAGTAIAPLPVHRNDEIGSLAKSFMAMASKLNAQIHALQTTQFNLDYLAHHDQLTGLPNRILFLDRLIQSIHKAHRNRSRFAVLFIDLDKFKLVNDNLGHKVGDATLKIAAARMLDAVRKEDTISRMGGDEFTAIVEELHRPDDVITLAQKMIALFDEPIIVGCHTFYLSCSIGIAIYPQDGERAEELLNNADSAMYQSKERGGNKLQLYSRPQP